MLAFALSQVPIAAQKGSPCFVDRSEPRRTVFREASAPCNPCLPRFGESVMKTHTAVSRDERKRRAEQVRRHIRGLF